ncbi:MAG: DUF3597 domain-containing protein [Gammaproteobacteria bacterium]
MGLFESILSAIVGATTTAAAPDTEATICGVDVAAVLDRLSAQTAPNIHWRSSIADLMRLLGVDPSYHNRRELALELGYQGDPSDPVKMSIWLHKHLMKRLSQNGATVPASLRH